MTSSEARYAMRRVTPYFTVGIVVCAAVGFASACGTSIDSNFTPVPGGDGGPLDDSEPPGFADASDDSPTGCTQCSGDLHNVLMFFSNRHHRGREQPDRLGRDVERNG